MPRRNHLGTLSLLSASAGFAVLAALRHHGLAHGPGWSILQSGFEAGMVGGAADWFAVSALFRPIPSPRFRIWHTGLIVEKRAALSAGIVDMVQNRWLAPEILAEHLGRLRASRCLLEHLARPAARAQLAGAARDLLGRLAGTLDAPEVAGFLDRALRDQLRDLDLGPAFGGWLEARILAGDTAALWDFLAGTLARAAEQGDFQAPIRTVLETAAEHYRSRGAWESFKVSAGELFFDYGQMAESLGQAFAGSLRAIQGDPAHPLRAKLDGHLLGFARSLAAGDPEARAALDRLRRGLAEHAELGPFLARILARLQDTVKAQCGDPDADLSRIMDRVLDTLLRELEAEPDTQAKLDAWVRRTVLDLAQGNHAVIGEMVQSALSRLSDRDLVAQIEDKVGADLQYIRLNGAVVGGLVGVALAVVRLVLGS
ncbi:MAG: DUF445 domain-containing protein [Holophaga sp.]